MFSPKAINVRKLYDVGIECNESFPDRFVVSDVPLSRALNDIERGNAIHYYDTAGDDIRLMLAGLLQTLPTGESDNS